MRLLVQLEVVTTSKCDGEYPQVARRFDHRTRPILPHHPRPTKSGLGVLGSELRSFAFPDE